MFSFINLLTKTGPVLNFLFKIKNYAKTKFKIKNIFFKYFNLSIFKQGLCTNINQCSRWRCGRFFAKGEGRAKLT